MNWYSGAEFYLYVYSHPIFTTDFVMVKSTPWIRNSRSFQENISIDIDDFSNKCGEINVIIYGGTGKKINLGLVN